MGRTCRMWMHGWGGRGALHDGQNASNVAARACRSCSQGKFPLDLSWKLGRPFPVCIIMSVLLCTLVVPYDCL